MKRLCKHLVFLRSFHNLFVFCHSICYDKHRIVCRCVSIHRNHVISIVDILTQCFLKRCFGNRSICRDKAQHRTHIRVNHAGTLRHSANRDCLAANLNLHCNLFLTGICRHNCFCSLCPGLNSITFRLCKHFYSCLDAVNWKLFSDDSCRSKKNTVCRNPQLFRCRIRSIFAVSVSFSPCAGISNPRIHNDRLCRFAFLYNFLIPCNRRRFCHIRRKCSCRHTRLFAENDRHICTSLILDICLDTCRLKSFCFRHSTFYNLHHAHLLFIY